MSKGFNLENLDTSVKPTENFYQYANGGWKKNNPIPPSEAAWGGFHEVLKHNEEILKTVLEELSQAEFEKGTNEQKLRDFYNTAMDENRLEEQGSKPAEELLQRIGTVKTKDDLPELLAYLHRAHIDALWYPNVEVDEKDPQYYALRLRQSGLGLPNRDYYLDEGLALKEIRQKYEQHIISMFELFGIAQDDAIRKARVIMEMETAMAQNSATPVELRNPVAMYNKFTMADLQSLVPSFAWGKYFTALGSPELQSLVVTVTKFMSGTDLLLQERSVEDWQTYLKWKVISQTAGLLNDTYAKKNFEFFGTVLTGAQEMHPRWKRTLRQIDYLMGEMLGKKYIERAFSPEAKAHINEMVSNLTAVFEDRLANLEWMTDETKAKAREKLSTFRRKLAYPDVWRDYSKLEINTDSHFANVMRAQMFETARQMAKVGKEVDRTEWFISPSTVNAFYDPPVNEIVFPAGILQAPFFDVEADDAYNYGGIGAVIGHELTHGFDDEGGQYDAYGKLENWWTEEDAKRFQERANVVVGQFNARTILDGVSVNGKLTLGENIADLGGLGIAYEAYMRSIRGKEEQIIDGFTSQQRFFLGYAQVWRENIRDEIARKLILTDPHAPHELRVVVPLSNMQEFYDAFNVQSGDGMYRDPATRAKIW